MALNDSPPLKLVVLVYGIKLIQVEVAECTRLFNFFDTILQSDQYDLPPEAYAITQKYQSRYIRYLAPDRPILIQNLDDIPKQFDPEHLLWLDGKVATTDPCSRRGIPLDGSGTLVNQGSGIERHPKVLFSGDRTVNETVDVWCKLATEDEVKTYEKLKLFDPEAHHVAALVVPPLALPTGDHLLIMPFYGNDLQEIIRWDSPDYLAGPFIHRLACQLCIAIDFLHDHNMYHLDIKPANLVTHEETCELTVIDLGWVRSGKQPCLVGGASGTYDYAPPEVKERYKWEDSSPCPSRYNPRKADAWAIGNVIHILLKTVLKDDLHEVTHSDELWAFSCWMMDRRPRMKEALQWLEVKQRSGTRIRSPFHVDRATSP
ncbi:kinase-like protein [Marasmius fiardii PR-910]|nr:kinase-like protein [Marasmius fiardii PR-910]KAF9258063.1 kinase-like protein [Marasmius fiardii PR-910]